MAALDGSIGQLFGRFPLHTKEHVIIEDNAIWELATKFPLPERVPTIYQRRCEKRFDAKEENPLLAVFIQHPRMEIGQPVYDESSHEQIINKANLITSDVKMDIEGDIKKARADLLAIRRSRIDGIISTAEAVRKIHGIQQFERLIIKIIDFRDEALDDLDEGLKEIEEDLEKDLPLFETTLLTDDATMKILDQAYALRASYSKQTIAIFLSFTDLAEMLDNVNEEMFGDFWEDLQHWRLTGAMPAEYQPEELRSLEIDSGNDEVEVTATNEEGDITTIDNNIDATPINKEVVLDDLSNLYNPPNPIENSHAEDEEQQRLADLKEMYQQGTQMKEIQAEKQQRTAILKQMYKQGEDIKDTEEYRKAKLKEMYKQGQIMKAAEQHYNLVRFGVPEESLYYYSENDSPPTGTPDLATQWSYNSPAYHGLLQVEPEVQREMERMIAKELTDKLNDYKQSLEPIVKNKKRKRVHGSEENIVPAHSKKQKPMPANETEQQIWERNEKKIYKLEKLLRKKQRAEKRQARGIKKTALVSDSYSLHRRMMNLEAQGNKLENDIAVYKQSNNIDAEPTTDVTDSPASVADIPPTPIEIPQTAREMRATYLNTYFDNYEEQDYGFEEDATKMFGYAEGQEAEKAEKNENGSQTESEEETEVEQDSKATTPAPESQYPPQHVEDEETESEEE